MEINEFKTLDKDSQIELIEEFEFDEENNLKWNLFAEILSTKTISDLTRIEVLNVLGASDIPQNKRLTYQKIILAYLNDKKEDNTFLCHCVMALQNEDLFAKEVYQKMLVIFLDPSEDEDLRHNADTIISNNTDGKALIEYYKKFIDNSDPVFSRYSKKWIDEVKQGLENKTRK